MQFKSLRYQLPKKAIKGNCPQCSPRHRRTLSRYVDTQTGEALPEQFGRCDRESNCGYYLSPYHKGLSGMSYADEAFEQWKQENPLPPPAVRRHQSRLNERENRPKTAILPPIKTPQIVTSISSTPTPVYTLPDEVFTQSLGHYESNQFARLLHEHFGTDITSDLLHRFQIGTSSYWDGASVFWLIDAEGRVRGGQVNLFADDWHRAKYTDREGNRKPCITSVSHGLLRHYQQRHEAVPGWLTDYHENADKWPVPFGLHQLRDAPVTQPVAIVEACKTAIVCAANFPEFIWLAIGGKSYLKAERISSLKERRIMLFPDLNAYHDLTGKNERTIKGWATLAYELRAEGFHVEISSLLEDAATEEQRTQGLDLADFLLSFPTVPKPDEQPVDSDALPVVTTLDEWVSGTILRPDPSQLEYL